MKGYFDLRPCCVPPVSDSEEIPQPAKMLGSSIADGRYNGVCDGNAGLLRGQYDNDSSLAVDPLCDMSTDRFDVRQSISAPSPSDGADPAPAE